MSDREKVINDLQRQIEELEERLAIVLEGKEQDQDYRGWLMDMFHKYGRDDLIALLVSHGEENLLADVLKEQQEAVEPYMDFDGHDVWRCGKCGATIFHICHNASDEDEKNYAKFQMECW